MNENLYLKQNTITNTSDDSYSFPWFPENIQRRKSRLGTHRKQARLLSDSDTKDPENVNPVENKPNICNSFGCINSKPVNLNDEDLSENKCDLKYNDFHKSGSSSLNEAVSKRLDSLDISSPIEDIVWRYDLKPVNNSPSIEEITPLRDIKSSNHTSCEQSVTINEFKPYKYFITPAENPNEKNHTSVEEFVTVDEYKQMEDSDVPTQSRRMSIDEFKLLNCNINSADGRHGSLNNNTSMENFVTTNEYKIIHKHHSVSQERCKLSPTADEFKPVNYRKTDVAIPIVETYRPMEHDFTPINELEPITVPAKESILENGPIISNIAIAPADKNEVINKSQEPYKAGVRFAELPPPVSSKIPSQIMVKNKSYKILNVLGKGGSSVVYQVLHPETNESLAVKRVKLTNTDEAIAQGYLDEVKLLEELQNCDVIIKMFDHELVYEHNKKFLYVVMEKGDTDLSELIRNVSKAKKLSIPMIVYYWSEMLSAVKEIHSRGIIHSDLKPANFLLVRGRLKLIDFGIASSVQGDMTSVYKDVFTGTLNYMSPEAVNYVQCPTGPNAGYRITFKTDVWSLGCILYNLIYGKLPFQHIDKRMEKMFAIVNPNKAVEFPEIKDIPFVLMDSLQSCLIKDPKKRPTVNQLLDRILRVYTSANN